MSTPRKVSDILSGEGLAFKDLFDYCENAKNRLDGTLCRSAILVDMDRYANLHISITKEDAGKIFGAANLQLLFTKVAVDLGFTFPWSTLHSSDDPDRVILRCKANNDPPVGVGSSVGIVFIPNVYRPFGQVTKPGISLKVVSFITA